MTTIQINIPFTFNVKEDLSNEKEVLDVCLDYIKENDLCLTTEGMIEILKLNLENDDLPIEKVDSSYWIVN